MALMILFAGTAFMISDPEADFITENVKLSDQVSLSDIKTKNQKAGAFKTSVEFMLDNNKQAPKEFYGQQIQVSGNPHFDRILIGITNNLIARAEIWQKDKLLESKELGFMDKMNPGASQKLNIDFYDQTFPKYRGKSKITMRFFSGSGFFGDIGTINIDLTKYGDLSGEKTIQLFAKSLSTKPVSLPHFSNLQIWKNFRSFD